MREALPSCRTPSSASLSCSSADEVRSVNPALRGEFLGGLYCPGRRDRRAPGGAALRCAPSLAGPSYDWRPGLEAVEVALARRPRPARHLAPGRPGGALHRGQLHRGGRAASGGVRRAGSAPAPTGGAVGAEPSGLRRVRLGRCCRRCRSHPPQPLPPWPTATRSAYHPAYELPSRAALPPQGAVAAAQPVAAAAGAAAGRSSLTIGDTHEYDEPFGFDVDETAYDHLLARAHRAARRPAAARATAWLGVLQRAAVGTPALYHRSQVAPGGDPGDRTGRARHDLLTCDLAEETFPVTLRRFPTPALAWTWRAPPSPTTTAASTNAFAAAVASRNLPVAEFDGRMKYAQGTTGHSKIEVFRAHPRG